MAQGKIGYLIYNICLAILAVFLLPYFVCRNLLLGRPILSYFKIFSLDELRQLRKAPVIWIQAVSVGETVVANCIISEIRKVLPEHQILLTTTTPTGQATAKRLLGDTVLITYYPFDLPIFIKPFIKRVKPELFIMTETEIWPNAIRYSKAYGAKVALVNGRISDRSFKRYYRLGRFLKTVLGQVDLLAMQSAEDANRIGELGAPLERIMVTGNAKFDQDYPSFTSSQLAEFRKDYGWGGARILTAASTHHGEEELIIKAYQEVCGVEPYYLILAPRHPDRGEEVAALLNQAGLSFNRRSAAPIAPGASVLLMDTFGELGLAYALADVVFVGGSLAKIGGHNLLEAAVQAKPVIYGPYMHNFRESKQLLEEAGAGFTVAGPEELVAIIRELTADPQVYQERAANARAAVLNNKGAAQNTAFLLAEMLRPK